MKGKILLADDEKYIRKLVKDFLKNEGFEVIEAIDGNDTLNKFYSEKNIDLVILDIMMPNINGYEVCNIIRKESEVPIIFLTALGDKFNEVKGFNNGADDYIAKPFEYEILIARVKSILNRFNKKKSLIINSIEVNQDSYSVHVNNNTVDLTPKEYHLLLYLINNKNKILSREKILNNVWGFDFYGDYRTVDTHIKQLRSKLDTEGENIKTVRGYGYKLEVKNENIDKV